MAEKMLNKREAIEFLGMDEKLFDNYFSSAGEIHSQIRVNGRGRYYFDQVELEKWRIDHKWRTVSLTIEDYAVCLDFALAQHFKGYVLSDFGTARQREFGQKITNWVKGQLGEIAVKKFFKEKFGIEVELDFEIRDEIVPQDIIGIVENKKMRAPKIGVAIKSSKPKSAYLVLSENEMTIAERKSEVYIFCRPDIPDDHLLRIAKVPILDLIKGEKYAPTYQEKIPSFENIPCEIAGYCWANELEKVSGIPGLEFDNGFRYVKKSGMLHRSKEDWEALLAKL